jgi:O-antigen/teichoic acid export membrane protein
MSAVTELRVRARAVVRDPMLVNSWLMLTTMAMMAAAGSVFWVIAARLRPAAEVGLAGSMVTIAESLALFAQLGLNITLIRTLPRSDRKASDVTIATFVVGGTGFVLATVYGLLLPVTSPRLHAEINLPFTVFVFAVLTAASAVNQLTDGVFLAINRLWSNLRINGVLLGCTKVALPFAFAGAGAIGLYSAVGLAAAIAAAASLTSIHRHQPDRPSLKASRQLRESRRFAGAGYTANVLYFLPQLVFPVLVVNARGPSESAVYFISFQIVTLLNAVVYAVCNSMYADSERAPHQRRHAAAKGGVTTAVATSLGVLMLWFAAPILLSVFGPEYADHGTATLRILTLGTLGVACNYWAAMRLRMAHHLPSMVSVQLFTTVVMVGLAVTLGHRGVEWVAASWGVGQLVGGLVGYVVSRTVAPVVDEPDPHSRRSDDITGAAR